MTDQTCNHHDAVLKKILARPFERRGIGVLAKDVGVSKDDLIAAIDHHRDTNVIPLLSYHLGYHYVTKLNGAKPGRKGGKRDLTGVIPKLRLPKADTMGGNSPEDEMRRKLLEDARVANAKMHRVNHWKW
ncbi:MAG: hypothetical protein AAGI10_07730 [Pseudomonadota bacterium]